MAPSESVSQQGPRADDAPAEGGPAACLSEKSCCAVSCAWEFWQLHGNHMSRYVGFQGKNIIALFIFSVCVSDFLLLSGLCVLNVCVSPVWRSAQHPIKLAELYHYLCVSGRLSCDLPPSHPLYLSNSSFFQWILLTLLSNSVWEFSGMPGFLWTVSGFLHLQFFLYVSCCTTGRDRHVSVLGWYLK